ncbi:MAG: Tn3 family transposase [Solirubrobacteraceae bacterium]
MIGSQLSLQESRHTLARRICRGQHGQLRERYHQGVEDQLGALGLVLNATVLWNTIYLDKARAQREAPGRRIPDEILAGFSPLIYEHINFNGRHPSNVSLNTPPELSDDCKGERVLLRPLTRGVDRVDQGGVATGPEAVRRR